MKLNKKNSTQKMYIVYSETVLDFKKLYDNYYLLSSRELSTLDPYLLNNVVGEIDDQDIQNLQVKYNEHGTLTVGETYIDAFSIFEMEEICLVKQSQGFYDFKIKDSDFTIHVRKTKCKVNTILKP